jgi:tRNA-dihydrouridine synthase A
MMGCTDRHCRFFLRLLAPGVRLYTEMITAQAITRGRAERLLAFDPAEHPVAVQLGGSDPRELSSAAMAAARYGYDEVNLNAGCPSDRVQSGQFGACLMKAPGLVADCVAAMCDAVTIPVTVKIRLGVDDLDSYEFVADFVARVSAAGCRTFIVHARKAILSGLSPRDNLQVPPLRYPLVYRLKQEFPSLSIHLNGGIASLDDIATHLQRVDGVMIGRKAYHDPWFLTAVQARFCDGIAGAPGPRRAQILQGMIDYARREQDSGVRLQHITRHLLGLFNGLPGARTWRRFLAEGAVRPGSGPELLRQSLSLVAHAEA